MTEPFAVEIDFDAASEAWHRNKKGIGNGAFQYVCGAPLGTVPETYCTKDPAHVREQKWRLMNRGPYASSYDVKMPTFMGCKHEVCDEHYGDSE